MAHRLSREAEADLNDIWYYVANQSGGTDVADRLVDTITDRFLLLARYPRIGRGRDDDLRAGLRSFSVGSYVMIYRIDGEDVLILRVLHGSRDIQRLIPE